MLRGEHFVIVEFCGPDIRISSPRVPVVMYQHPIMCQSPAPLQIKIYLLIVLHSSEMRFVASFILLLVVVVDGGECGITKHRSNTSYFRKLLSLKLPQMDRLPDMAW